MRRKYINEAFFDEWTEESAYILGFIWSDGCLYRNGNLMYLSVCNNELQIIERIKEVMESDYAITLDRRYNGSYQMKMGNQVLIARLQQIGLIERKSKTKEWPIGLPDEMVPHFVRGYFDGNGCFSKYKSNGSDCITAYFASGSYAFISKLRDVLHEAGYKKATIETNRSTSVNGVVGECYRIKFYVNETKKLYDYLYENATIFMDSKKEKYQAGIESYLEHA